MFFKLSAEEPDVVLQSDPGKCDPNYIKSTFPAPHFIRNFIIPGSKSHPPQRVDPLSFSSRKTSSCLPDHLFQICLAHQIGKRITWFIICFTNTVIYLRTKKPGSSLPPSEGSHVFWWRKGTSAGSIQGTFTTGWSRGPGRKTIQRSLAEGKGNPQIPRCFDQFFFGQLGCSVRTEHPSTYGHFNQPFHQVGPTCMTYESSSKAEEHHHNTLEK